MLGFYDRFAKEAQRNFFVNSQKVTQEKFCLLPMSWHEMVFVGLIPISW